MRSLPEPVTYPKIELHVHLDSAMRPSLLLRLARRNGYVLPFATVEEFADYCRVKSFVDLGRIWVETCGVLQREQDFREVLVAYAGEAKCHGAVYVEAIFNPWMMWKRGVSLDAIFTGTATQSRKPAGSTVSRFGTHLMVTDAWSLARRRNPRGG